MKRKLFISTILLLALSSGATGRTIPVGSFFDRFVLGAEWGYTQCFYQNRNYNFITEEGYRVFEQNSSFYGHANAQVLGTIGFRLSEQLTLGLYSGYIGIGEKNRLIPACLRASYFPSTDSEDGLFAYAQGGAAWHVHKRLVIIMRVCIKYLHDHPSIPNPEGPGNVPEHNIRMNNAGYCALDISIAVSF